MTFKKTFTIGFAGIAATMLLLPVLILAQNETAKGICARLTETYSKIDQRITSNDAMLGSKRTDIDANVANRQHERDGWLSEKRLKWDENRAEHFAKLEARAQTEEQQQAVATFIATVEAAVIARRDAIDQAIEDYREGVEAITDSHRGSADAVIANYRNAVKAAFDAAQAECDAGGDVVTVRQNLNTALTQARNNFQNERQQMTRLGELIEPLNDARREAIQQAIDDFKATLQQAFADLKAAFPSPETEEI